MYYMYLYSQNYDDINIGLKMVHVYIWKYVYIVSYTSYLAAKIIVWGHGFKIR